MLEYVAIEERVLEIKEYFSVCTKPQQIYEQLISLGRRQSPLAPHERCDDNLVPGCQSVMYLASERRGEVLHLRSESDALISSGLAQLLVWVYDNQPPEEILRHNPSFLQELGIPASLTPGRANGLASLLKRIRQRALEQLMSQSEFQTQTSTSDPSR